MFCNTASVGTNMTRLHYRIFQLPRRCEMKKNGGGSVKAKVVLLEVDGEFVLL